MGDGGRADADDVFSDDWADAVVATNTQDANAETVDAIVRIKQCLCILYAEPDLWVVVVACR